MDEMEQKQIWLALERLSGQVAQERLGNLDADDSGYGIHKLYSGSTQEHFLFPCPHCGRWTELVWPDCIEIIGEHVPRRRCDESFLKCKECKARLEHERSRSSWRTAKWMSTAPNANPDIRGLPHQPIVQLHGDARRVGGRLLPRVRR